MTDDDSGDNCVCLKTGLCSQWKVLHAASYTFQHVPRAPTVYKTLVELYQCKVNQHTKKP